MKRTLAALVLAVGAFLGADDDDKKGPVPPAVGDAAPVFTLNDHNGEARTIGGESDTWTVVAWYPKAATPG